MSGEHSRQAYVALLFGIARRERTGVLEVRQGRNWRRLRFARGVPVSYASSLESESLAKTLVKAGMVAAKPLKKVQDKLRPGEHLQDELISLGLLDEEELVAHHLAQLERGSAAPLAWPKGTWTFAVHDRVSPAIDPNLLPPASALRGLWSAVLQHLDMEEAASFVSAADAGPLKACEGLQEGLAQLGVEGALATLHEQLPDEGMGADEIFRLVQDRSGTLLHLLWVLESAGLLHRPGRPLPDDLAALVRGDLGEEEPDYTTDQKAREEAVKRRTGEHRKASSGQHSKPGAAEAAQNLANLPGLLKAARKQRMSRTFYGFLDVKPTAHVDEIESSYRRLVQLWQTASRSPSIPPEAKRDAHALVQAALTIWKTLSEPDRRREYDRRLGQGRAPALESLVTATSGRTFRSNPGIEAPTEPRASSAQLSKPRAESSHRTQVTKSGRARRLVDSGEFAQAMPLLRQLRLENPSDGAILADLGWTTWKLKGSTDSGEESADDYLQLALTFDPTNTRALEFLARLAHERGSDDEARRYVQRLLAIEPDSKWGTAAMRSFGGSPRRGRRG